MNFSTTGTTLGIDAKKTFNGVHKVDRVDAANSVDGSLETILVHPIVSCLIVQFSAVFQGCRLK